MELPSVRQLEQLSNHELALLEIRIKQVRINRKES